MTNTAWYFDEYRESFGYDYDDYDDLGYDYFDDFPDTDNPTFHGYSEYGPFYTEDQIDSVEPDLLDIEDRWRNYEAGLLHPESV